MAGGGGRIALYADDLSGMNTNQLSAAGGDTSLCDGTKGLPGSVRTLCLTRTCFNGGQVKDDSSGECGCNCVAPWSGHDCQVCDRQCVNGGELDPNSCTCSCPFRWGGATCNECNGVDLCSGNGSCDLQQVCTCDPDYYKSDCSAYCTQELCSLNGFCTDEGECDCIPSKVGPTCACDKLICSASTDAAQAFCSGHGTCAVDQCVCDPGYYNCDCSVFCSADTTCSGHGTCAEDGSCKCEYGWDGSDCSEQDVELYCFQQSDGSVNTITGHPCLPGLHGMLGYGYDIVEDTRTVPITKLSYTEGNRFTHYLLGTFEIPDGVECQELTVDKASTSSRTFRTFQEYRVSLAAGVGVSPAKFKNSFFSGSAEASYVYENAFQQERFYSQSIQTYSLYKCRLKTVQPSLVETNALMNATAAMTPERKAAHVGTHVIQEAAYGGYLAASAFVSLCVLNSLTIAEVNREVSYAVVELSTSGKYTSSCSVFNSYATFESLKGGGNKSALSIIQTDRDDTALKTWVNTLQVSPAATKKLLVDLGSIIPEFGPSIDAYVAIETVQQQNQVAPETCPENLSCARARQSHASISMPRDLTLSVLTSLASFQILFSFLF